MRVAESPDISRRDKRRFHDIKAEQVSDPFRITLVGLFAFDGFHILGVCKDDMHMRFKDIKNRNPVFPRGFHADIAAVLCEEPVAQGGDI